MKLLVAGLFILGSGLLPSLFAQAEFDGNGRKIVVDTATISIEPNATAQQNEEVAEQANPLFDTAQVLRTDNEQEWTFATVVPRIIALEKQVQELLLANEQLRLENRRIKQQVGMNIVAPNAYLFQTSPMPTSEILLIQYSIPDSFEEAVLELQSIYGETLATLPLQRKAGAGQLSLKPYALPTGTYIYCLLVDKEIIDSKILLITP